MKLIISGGVAYAPAGSNFGCGRWGRVERFLCKASHLRLSEAPRRCDAVLPQLASAESHHRAVTRRVIICSAPITDSWLISCGISAGKPTFARVGNVPVQNVNILFCFSQTRYYRVPPMFLSLTELVPLLIQLVHISDSFIFSLPFDGVLVILRGKHSVIDSRNFLMYPTQPTIIPSRLVEMLS